MVGKPLKCSPTLKDPAMYLRQVMRFDLFSFSKFIDALTSTLSLTELSPLGLTTLWRQPNILLNSSLSLYGVGPGDRPNDTGRAY